MNKRVVLAAAGILLVASLASCGRNSGDATTVPALTGATQSTLGNGQQLDSSAALAATTAGNASPTYILTTQQGQTMATVPLTAFSLDTPATTVAIPDDFTNPPIDIPDVVTAVIETLPTQAPTTASADTSTKPITVSQTTTAEPTTAEPTTAAKKVRKSIDMISCGTDPNNGNLIITFDPSGWEGGVSNTSRYITVNIDGKERPVKVSVNGKPDADGYATIKVYSSEYEPADGSVISVVLPDGLVTSKNGTQESTSFSTHVEYKTP